MRRIFTRHWRRFWLRAGFALAILATAIFGLRAAWFAWELSARDTRPVAGWMTPRYISAVYDVEPDALAKVLGLPQGSDPRESIARLAAASDRPVAEVVDQIEVLIEESRDAE